MHLQRPEFAGRARALRFITRAPARRSASPTKVFTTQLGSLYLLTLIIAKLRGRLTEAMEAGTERAAPPAGGGQRRCSNSGRKSATWAERFAMKPTPCSARPQARYHCPDRHGRRAQRKSPSGGLPGRQAKHGPRSSTKEMPVIVAPNDDAAGKAEIQPAGGARQAANLTSFADAEKRDMHTRPDGVRHPAARALRAVVGVATRRPRQQLLAYPPRLVRGTDVDKPRNLAKW